MTLKHEKMLKFTHNKRHVNESYIEVPVFTYPIGKSNSWKTHAVGEVLGRQPSVLLVQGKIMPPHGGQLGHIYRNEK